MADSGKATANAPTNMGTIKKVAAGAVDAGGKQ